ncbi:MAG: hypothetical protein GY867_01030 [bacterium]|nr:hypothetical protein [bacterium]
MPIRICIYEDESFRRFLPLTHLRPVFLMRSGILPLYQRAQRFFDKAEFSLAARHNLAGLIAAQVREYPVNIIKREEEGEVLFLSGRIRDFGDLPRLVHESRISTAFRNDGEVVGVLFKKNSLANVPPLATQNEYMSAFRDPQNSFPDCNTSATLYGYPWELVADIGSEIAADFAHLKPTFPDPEGVKLHRGAHMLNEDEIYFGAGVQVSPGTVIDASHGPVYVGDNTRIEPQVAIFGPCYIGPNSAVVAGKIAGSSIGHTSRVGGEVEESIFQAYVNKYHAGFIGHSYVGAWVNFGAMTTNSDLKNNYSNIRVSQSGESLDTGSIKVGSFIGDHTKFGIGTLLNTGINIGVCCNIYGGGLVVDKEVASFSWGNSSGYVAYRLDKALDTARRTVERRDVTLSAVEEQVLAAISEGAEAVEGLTSFETDG